MTFIYGLFFWLGGEGRLQFHSHRVPKKKKKKKRVEETKRSYPHIILIHISAFGGVSLVISGKIEEKKKPKAFIHSHLPPPPHFEWE